MSPKKYQLVLVEDSEDDAVLFGLNLRRTGLDQSFDLIRRFSCGEDAIDYFANPSRTLVPEPLPDILLLDIKLPGCSGLDVLAKLPKLDPRPVLAVYTSSALPEDKQKAEALGAGLFETKKAEPADFSRFLLALGRLAYQRRPI